ncbi:hypothetical protein GW17_00019959 [Ensete ventricosum]|nr:hypothetical protein GW17_00019959 [Ensete ventricosum]
MDSDAAQEQERKGGEDESENIKLRMSALDRLEKASEDSLFGQTGKTFTTKGMEVLERVGKETMDLLIAETGLEVEKGPVNQQADKEEIEEVTFDSLGTIVEENGVDPDIGNVIETTAGDNDTEMKRLCDSSVKRAADIAAG